MGWRPRALVFDVDGTLTGKDRKLDAAAVEALRRAEAAGVPVILATGNVLPIAYALTYLIGTSGPLVAENGGLVLYRGALEELVKRDEVEAVAAAVEGELALRRLFTDRWRVTEVAFPEGPSTFEAVRAAVARHPLAPRVKVERTGFAVHVMNADSAKFRGVSRALELLGLAPQDALSCGDSDNDIEMVRRCRVGVALGDASPRLKAAADFVAGAAAGAGIEEALVAFGVLRGASKASGARGAPIRARPRRQARAPRKRRQAPARTPRRRRRAARPAGRR